MVNLIKRLRELDAAANVKKLTGKDYDYILDTLPQLLDRLEKLERLAEIVDYSGVGKDCTEIADALAALEEKK